MFAGQDFAKQSRLICDKLLMQADIHIFLQGVPGAGAVK